MVRRFRIERSYTSREDSPLCPIVERDDQESAAVETGCGSSISTLLRDVDSLAANPRRGGSKAFEQVRVL